LCALGTVLGPLNHVWYSALDKFLVGKATTTVAKKILLDQLIGSPMFAFTFFMGRYLQYGRILVLYKPQLYKHMITFFIIMLMMLTIMDGECAFT
jgi:hypothetical protein